MKNGRGTNGHAVEPQRWCIQTHEGRVFLVYTRNSIDAAALVLELGVGGIASCERVGSVEETFKLHPLPPDYWEKHVRQAAQGRKRR